jgi:site-specific recombinase XerD
MKRIRLPLVHPLAEMFFAAIQSVTTSMSDSTKGRYRTTAEYFLRYLREHHPDVRTLDQLRRDPYVLGWLTWLASQHPPLVKSTRSLHVISLRRLMEELAWLHDRPALVRLFHPDDVPQPAARFPRPLTPEQDRLIQQELLRRNDVTSNALLLIRYTGIRIGECVDLSFDCLRLLAPGQWALHVPLGKLNTERVVPIDDSVCQLVHRLRFFRFLSAVPPDGLLLARRRNRSALLRELRTALTQVRTALGIARPLVPHMFRHTFATEMMRSGVSFAALMNLLGHSTPKMTLLYSEFTQTDLQREFRAAGSQPRHLVPPARAATSTIGLKPDLTSTVHALEIAQHVMEMFRRTLSDTSADASPVIDRLANRLTKIAAELRKLAPK